jgi:hypothetical protein
MTLRDLIDALMELEERYGDELEVRTLHQPSYPMQETLVRVGVVGIEDDEGEYQMPDLEAEDQSAPEVVYLVNADSNNYGPDFRTIVNV